MKSPGGCCPRICNPVLESIWLYVPRQHDEWLQFWIASEHVLFATEFTDDIHANFRKLVSTSVRTFTVS
jgi:hypothetical protein